jgi:hypothetical protein
MIRAKTVSIVQSEGFLAGREAAVELLEELGEEPELVLLFASTKYDQQRVLDGLHSKLGANVRLAGCSSYAEINSEEGLTGSVTAMGLTLKNIAVETFRVDSSTGNSAACGTLLGERVAAFRPDLLLVFPDGLQLNSTRFLLGLQGVLGMHFPIIGGVAADGGTFTQTFEYHDREAITGGATAVAFKGDIQIVTAAKSGWIPVGSTLTCTKVEDGNVLLELNGRPALDIYKEWLGPRADEMPFIGCEFPIGLVGGVPSTQNLPDEQVLLLRAVKGVDEARKAIVFGGDVPEGAEVRMTRATKEDVIRGADEAGVKICEAMAEPSFALFFDCIARKLVLGPRYKQELKTSFDRIGAHVPKIGFYTFGELSPVQGVTMHHDETFTMALIKG